MSSSLDGTLGNLSVIPMLPIESRFTTYFKNSRFRQLEQILSMNLTIGCKGEDYNLKITILKLRFKIYLHIFRQSPTLS